MSGLEAAVALVAALAWPSTVLLLALCFRAELRGVLQAATRLLERATALRIGMLTAAAERPLPPRRSRT